MERTSIRLTTAQFAKLHEVNKRTLHFYDTIGLFSPREKGENGYRYYDVSQSVEFEYIRMLRDLNMSIEEIERYVKCPSPEKFLELSEMKEKEIDAQIQELKQIKKTLQTKKEQVHFCEKLQGQEIRIVETSYEKSTIN